MSYSLVRPHSPLDQLNRRKRLGADSAMSPRLGAADEALVKAILSQPMQYVDHPLFRRPNAQRKLIKDAAVVPAPNVSWYRPVVDRIGREAHSSAVVNVLLSAAEEKTLFLQMHYARFRVARLQKKIGGGTPTPLQARQLLRWYRLALQRRDQIAQCNLALVLAMAKRVRAIDMDFADLVSEGNMALLRAIEKFNVARGFKFSTYACRSILKAFGRVGMKQSRYRQLFPTDFDPALERSDQSSQRSDQHESDCASIVRQIVQTNSAVLTHLERQIISHRFALDRPDDRHAANLTLEQVGKLVGLTKERVRQIQKIALTKIRRALEEGFIDGNEAAAAG